jgi:hypothetical protein
MCKTYFGETLQYLTTLSVNLKPMGSKCATCFEILQLYIRLTKCIYAFLMILTIKGYRMIFVTEVYCVPCEVRTELIFISLE